MTAPEFIDETIKTTGGDAPPSPVSDNRTCPKCSLHVPTELDKCPNDGTPMAQSAQDLLSSRYEMLEMIGKGGMSVIYKARHRLMNNTVAIKLLQEKLTQEKSSVKRFQLEAQAASRLDHPSIIKVLDFGVLEHGHTYLVMDYVVGRNLSEVIQESGTIAPERALPLFIQICEGLSHAHQKGVLHRDLKPSNLLLIREEDGAERIKIVDFGIAKVLGEDGSKLTSTGEVFGSPLYMSPEQCMGQDVDARSDIYSMGCLMYEALAGEAPHHGSNPLETIYKQMNVEAEPLSTHLNHAWAKRLDVVLNKALAKERSERYQSMAELLDDLQKVQSGITVAPKRKTIKPAWIAGYVAALTAIGLTTGYFLQKQDEPAPLPKHAVNEPIDTISPIDLGPKQSFSSEELLKAKQEFPPGTLTAISTTGDINLPYNGLDDRHCALLAKFPELRSIDLRANPRITSAGITMLTMNRERLNHLFLDGTSVDDQFLGQLSPTSPLIKITVGNTRVTSKAFPQFAKFAKLGEIWLYDLHLTDADIEKLPPLPKVTRLKLDNNPQLTDASIAKIVARCPKLELLTARGCPLLTNKCLPYISNSSINRFAAYGSQVTKDGNAGMRQFRIQLDPMRNPGSEADLKK